MIENIKKNHLYVGRGATAIYLVLKQKLCNKEVILPANICYAAVYPVLYSQNIPVFIDIDINTGNMKYEDIIKRITPNTGAIIYPYMYGNVDLNILRLKEYCKVHNIILIEDCASAMGATINGAPVGSIGDYSIFSTGHAKILDVGNGGLLLADEPIDNINDMYYNLNLYNEDISNSIDSFSKTYRVLRNENNLEKQIEFFKKDYEELFIYKIDENIVSNIKDKMEELPAIINNRKEKYNMFLNMINKSEHFKVLELNDESVPWRFSLIINDVIKRRELIKKILEANLFISDWYPNIGKIFTDDIFPNADYMEERIVNFSLLDSDEDIEKICNMINEHFNE